MRGAGLLGSYDVQEITVLRQRYRCHVQTTERRHKHKGAGLESRRDGIYDMDVATRRDARSDGCIDIILDIRPDHILRTLDYTRAFV